MALPFLYRTGKTLLAKTLARYVNVPFVIADATAITQVILAAITHVLGFSLIYLLGLISHQLGPTAFWALFLRPDRGRPTLHGWWAPVPQRYKGKVGAGARSTRLTAPPVTPPTF